MDAITRSIGKTHTQEHKLQTYPIGIELFTLTTFIRLAQKGRI